jgi:arylsulfatase A-like enzyme
MRADFLTEANAPTLWKLAHEGVTFRNHHSVYPTLTNVNATALATGVYPNRSGPIGNYEYRPEIDRAKTIRTDAPETMRTGDELTEGKFLAVPTIAELVQRAGGWSVVAGTKTAPLLFDRKPAEISKEGRRSISLFDGTTLPASANESIVKLLGAFPSSTMLPAKAWDNWTTRALTELLWKEELPDLSVLWMAEPDRSEHATAPGSETTLAAIKSSDANLSLVLQALDRKHVRDQTDIFVVSDHGFSSIGRAIDVAGLLAKDGFTVHGARETPSAKGEIHVVGNGGTDFFYVSDHDSEVTTRLVEWLQRSDFAGVIFSRSDCDGAFPLAQVHLDTAAGPDVVMTFRWSERANEHGIAGTIDTNGTSGDAKGTHGTLSPFDVHNMLVAAGPDFRKEAVSDLPTSNLDVAPSILHLLGITPPHQLDGRVVSEAMMTDGTTPVAAEPRTLEATHSSKAGTWRQYLRVSGVGAEVYIDEGNGSFSPAH